MKQILSTVGALLLGWVMSVQGVPESDYDAYGGWKKIQGKKTGFFHTQKVNGKWWIISPEGNVFFSKITDFP